MGMFTSFPTTTSETETYCNTHAYIVCAHYQQSIYDSMMVQCEHCESWFHHRCVGIRRNLKALVCAQCK